MQELRAKLLFKLPDLATERRLGNVELLRRATKATFSRHSHEISEMSEFHDHTSKVWK